MNTSKEVILDAANSMVQQLRIELESITRNRCETCGAKIYCGPPDCPVCGAPNCCPQCCKIDSLTKERDELKIKLLEVAHLKHDRDELKAKLAQVEADAAAMRESLMECGCLCVCKSNQIPGVVQKALATGSGQRLIDELAELRDTAKRRLELLKRMEWTPSTWASSYCPVCHRQKESHHQPDCPLAAELKDK